MFISKIKIFIFNISENNKRKTINIDNSFNVKMKDNNNNNNNATISEEFNNIKIVKSKIVNDQRRKLKNWLLQLKLYFAFNTIKNDWKTLFVVSRMNEKAFNWIKFNMEEFLYNNKDIDKIFNVFDRFKIIIQRIFIITNETIIFIKMIQHLSQKTSTVDYVQQFKEHANNILQNDKVLIIMFYRNLKSNVKNEIIKKRMQYTNLDTFIFATISIDDNWYKKIFKNKFEKSMRDKINIHRDEIIKRRENYYRRE